MPFKIKKNSIYTEFIFYDNDEKKESNEERERNYINESSNRSKLMIQDYALSNKWNYFFTITINKDLYDRTNYDLIVKRLKYTFNNIQKRKDKNFKYILVPELHKKIETNGKKAIHFHGLVNINTTDLLNYFDFDDKKEYKDKYGNIVIYYQSNRFLKLYGFNQFTKIYNNGEFLTYYISKYIAKYDIKELITSQRYYKSKGLDLPIEQIYEHHSLQAHKFKDLGLVPDFENKFITKYKFYNNDVLLDKVLTYLNE